MKNKMKTILATVLCIGCLAGLVNTPIIADAEDVKISNVNYTVSYEGATDIFLCNKTSIGSDEGTEVYLTYTVDSVETCKSTTQGVAATGQPDKIFPYTTGAMEYDNAQQLLQAGYSYFYKFKVTADGFEYTIIRAKGEESTYLDMLYTTGKKTDPLEYFGVWMGGGEVRAKLKNVRCYDRNGNDLGVRFSRNTGVSCAKDVSYKKNDSLNHYYTVTFQEQHTVALCNLKATESNRVFMEYTVESSDTNIIQTGALITQAPTTIFPYSAGNGYMVYESMAEAGDGNLLLEGAEYIICMEKKEDDLSVTVQRTYKGEKKIFSFPVTAGEYGKKFNYFGLWLGQGTEYRVNCVLTNFKCYDGENNNLGLQCNRKFTAEHFGEIEDYAGCEAVYYCEQDKTMIALYKDRSMKYTKDGVTLDGTYHISDDEDKIITISYGNGKEGFSYLYKRFESEDGRVYDRLGTYRVTFVTGSETEIDTQVLSSENGFVVTKPDDPKKDDNTFQCWVTKDGADFDFDSVVTQSVTLYAKWTDSDGRVVIASETEQESADYSIYIAGGVGGVILIASMIGCVLLIRRGGKKHGKEE